MSNRGRHKKSNKHLIVQILGQGVANRIIKYQTKQGNPPNLDVFLLDPTASRYSKGFTWDCTEEGHAYWDTIFTVQLKVHPLYQKWKEKKP